MCECLFSLSALVRAGTEKHPAAEHINILRVRVCKVRV